MASSYQIWDSPFFYIFLSSLIIQGWFQTFGQVSIAIIPPRLDVVGFILLRLALAMILPLSSTFRLYEQQ